MVVYPPLSGEESEAYDKALSLAQDNNTNEISGYLEWEELPDTCYLVDFSNSAGLKKLDFDGLYYRDISKWSDVDLGDGETFQVAIPVESIKKKYLKDKKLDIICAAFETYKKKHKANEDGFWLFPLSDLKPYL